MSGLSCAGLKQVAFFAILACTGLSRAQTTVALKARPSTGPPAVWIVKSSKATEIPDSEAWKPLSWSSDGRWLALGKATKNGFFNLSVVDTSSATLIKLELGGECSQPSWSPDGKQFVVSMAGSGLRLCNLAGSDPLWSPLVPAGSMPSWSPNGGRIAFVGPEGGMGIWTVSDESQNAHAILKQTGASQVAWAPDGRTLAVAFANKKTVELSLVSPGGQVRKIGTVDPGPFSWAPNASSLLVLEHGQWSVLSIKSGSSVETGLHGQIPQWSDSKTLLTSENGTLEQLKVGSKTLSPVMTTKPTGLPEGTIESFALFRGLVLDGQFSNPWAKSPPPKLGQIRIVGTVDDIDLTEDLATVKVWSVMTPDGMELNLARPVSQVVRLTPGSKRASSTGSARLEATDLRTDAEILLLVQGLRAGVLEPLTVDYGVLPELVESTAPSDAALNHPARLLDSDGVSMDTVVVPMVFPVVGEVKWSDTFLANRDGGNRRHHGQDLLAPKMRPLVAAFDGVVSLNRSKAGHNTITLRGDTGWTVVYMHVNNDHPGTDDGNGGDRNAFAPGLHTGDSVVQGQLLGFCGDSGNAENTVSHCHFELHDDVGGGVLNACPSLESAEHLSAPIARAPQVDCPLEPGEVRWDVCVVKLDKERNVIVGELICQQRGGGQAEAACFPKQVFIKLSPETRIALRADSKEVRKSEDIKPGQFMSAIGKQPLEGQAMDCRFAGLGLSLSQ